MNLNPADEREPILSKPPQRPHHWMNANGTCHAGDAFEDDIYAAIPLYTFDQMEAWVRAERRAFGVEARKQALCEAADDLDDNGRVVDEGGRGPIAAWLRERAEGGAS